MTEPTRRPPPPWRSEASAPEVPSLPRPGRVLISDPEFKLFQQLVLREAGIHLGEPKRELLMARLGRRLRELGLGTFGAYYRRVRSDPAELAEMLDRIATNETGFFREPAQFELLARRIFPAWESDAQAGRRPRTLRAWSAGCSTGEEPYSLAMCALAHLPGWSVEILATDLSHRALARAREALYPLARADQVPTPYRKRFMLRGERSREGWMKAGPELRSVVRFDHLNLSREVAPGGAYDLILCRNVLIYFHPATRARTLRAVVGRLAPGGYLLLGHSESPGELWDRLRRVVPTVYSNAGVGEAGR